MSLSESEISVESDYDVEGESLYERLAALKDIVPPSARKQVTSSVSYVSSLAKSSIAFSGKALWILSTSAFLLGVPWALAYAEEEQYIQMEREQGMIKGANEVCALLFLLWGLLRLLSTDIAADVNELKTLLARRRCQEIGLSWLRLRLYLTGVSGSLADLICVADACSWCSFYRGTEGSAYPVNKFRSSKPTECERIESEPSTLRDHPGFAIDR